MSALKMEKAADKEGAGAVARKSPGFEVTLEESVGLASLVTTVASPKDIKATLWEPR